MPSMGTPRGGPRSPFRFNRVVLLAFSAAALSLVFVFSGKSFSAPSASNLAPSSLLTSAGIPTWAEDWADEEICSNSCPYANDGVCHEGRSGINGTDSGTGPYDVMCDLGTDCTDCGAWRYVGPRKFLKWTPVKDLMKRKVQLHVRSTATPVPFWMPYTDPSLDVDVSGQMAEVGLIEPGLTWVWHKLLKKGCGGLHGARGLVLDIGANFGYYSLMSAAMGCRVVAWEPVPKFSAFLRYGLLRNLFVNSVELRERVVAAKGGVELTMEVPTSGIWGTAGIGGKNINSDQKKSGTEKVKAVSERVDEVVPSQDVLFMKIDVEGFEPGVLASSKGLLQGGKVENIIMEYSPGVVEANADWALSEDNPGKLLGLVQEGYTILHLNESFRVASGFSWDGKLPVMRRVTEESLRHDVEDAKRLQAGTLGCPLPPTIEMTGNLWKCPGTFEMERLSPKGFRSLFGYNTNLWMTKDLANSPATPGAPASLMPPNAGGGFDVKRWFIPGGVSYPYYPGHHLRICSEISPRDQLRFRCRCSDAEICGLFEAEIVAAVTERRMPPLPLPANASVDLETYSLEKW